MASTIDIASSSSSSTQTSRWANHVFLSFRGNDTRKGFTNHLFASLEKRGIKTFRDDHDLERGKVIIDELMKAIEESMFALIILSPNYASSTWCLDELLKILECKETNGQEVFPIFYGVDPSDVRHQRGSFAKAFREHEEKFKEDREKVERWRYALKEVASFSGWDSKDRHEATLVETIVGYIQKKIIPKLRSCIDNLVGINSRIKEVKSFLDMKLNDVHFIGIWGMGGIGKTTIARLVYEEIKEKFEVGCFLENIREQYETKGLIHIQKELLSFLNISDNNIYNHHDSKKILANSLRNKKVLLVLDDVSDLSQLESLAGKLEWFGPGSRVIITTRDKHLLATHGVLKICKTRCLVQNEALKLFCLNAFKQDQPKEGYLNLCKEVVEYTEGLPLALEVLGSHLHGRCLEVWHSALKQIKSVPHWKILDTLKISYDSLSFMEKKLFLDIACFFKGMEKDKVIDILENCGDHPKIGIDILIERSLVTLYGLKDKLGMHDLLQEMGRNIVFQESPNDPGKRSRLWSKKDIDGVLAKNKGTDKIEAIVWNSNRPYEAQWNPKAFCKTSQVRLLKLGNMLPLGLNCLPSALKVLDWRECPLKILPLSNQAEEIVDLKLEYSNIEQLWDGTKVFEMLKSIDLSFSENLKQSPNINGVPNLESLVLKGCVSLTEIHPSLVRHKKLVLMNLEGCKRLKALPCKMEMSSLKCLNLSGCSEFKHLPDFGEGMKKLRYLYLGGTAITKLPSSLGSLVGLTHLHLSNCKNLVCLPTIGELKSLSILNVSGCSKLHSLPETSKEVECLEELCRRKTAIEELPSSSFCQEKLISISSSGFKGPVSKSVNMFFLPFKWLFWGQQDPIRFILPHFILCLPSLSHLNLSYYNLSEESIPDDFCHLSSLMILDLSGNNFVSPPSSISKLPNLENLCLNWCKRLQQLPELPSNMRKLEAGNCASLEFSKFNPPWPCRIFTSREPRSCLEGQHICKARFDMLISGSEIPSWFAPTETQVYHNCPSTDWVGVAVCFQLVDYDRSFSFHCHHKVAIHLCHHEVRIFLHYKNLPHIVPYRPHLYIFYLPIRECHHKLFEDGDSSKIKFELECAHCSTLQIVGYGCRLVHKHDVEDIWVYYF